MIRVVFDKEQLSFSSDLLIAPNLSLWWLIDRFNWNMQRTAEEFNGKVLYHPSAKDAWGIYEFNEVWIHLPDRRIRFLPTKLVMRTR